MKTVDTRHMEQKNQTAFHFVRALLTNAGLWFSFLLVVYIILLLKAVTYDAITTNWFFGLYSLLITTYILSRFLLAYFHKPVYADPNYEPTVTFVVPAKNEEDNIAETVRRFAHVEYPKEKIEIIAINDGSTDNTLEEMHRIKQEIEPVIKSIVIVDWEKNRGKRHGMAEGVKRAKNDIVVFVDSDSFIEPSCVRHLVKYFADPTVGSVSGHTDVYNRDTNLLTQMQGIRYYIAFKVYKAAESVFGIVTCCPGCCSAYRREYLLEFIDQWLYQTFLGAPCTFGDDRSLTNFVIKKYKAVYSTEAMAHTVVPDTFKKYLKQQQRWKKSWVRETFIAGGFMWKKNVFAMISFYSYVFLALTSPIVFFRAMAWHPIVEQEWPIVYLLGLLLMLLLHGLYYRIKVGSKAWVLAIISFWFNTVILMWQLPWAVITIRDSRWGTR
jgi:hyaluronan synthase